jgi:two-component system chemotaxis sensor kinase CheA
MSSTSGVGSLDDLDQSFILEAMPAFISEALEQTETLEQLLLQLEAQPDDSNLLNALFRCAHTVKGSAGIFGLDAIVAFTHHVETLLDLLRDGAMQLTPALNTLLLQCNDQVRLLVRAASSAAPDEADATASVRSQLVQQLQAACDAGCDAACDTACDATNGAQPAEASAATAPPRAQDAPAGMARWQLAVAFGTDTFRNGMDPLALLNYLRGVGSIEQLQCDARAVPPLDSIDPESCHLAFTLALDTARPREDIDDAFSFVRDDCSLRIERSAPVDAPAGHANAAAGPAAPGEHLVSASAQASPDPRPALPATRAADGTAVQPVAEEQRVIRVQADRLDAVINLLGELIIAGAGAALLARQTQHAALIEANEDIGRLIEEIRNGTLALRMVPIGETFSRFRRVVRDTAAELGKDVQLDIQGGDTELDKSMVDRIADPLMHLVRNALDHGLEPPGEREAAGKPRQGRLVLSACHEAGSILLRITDDGRGIQRQKVLQRAWDRGLVEPGVVPADADIDRLIFEPGFSTAEAITKLSGRGVGMDVVRSNIEALRGTVALNSEPGAGSCIEIRLPLTLAIIDGFLVSVGASKFIFPLDAVVEVVENRGPVAALDRRGRGCIELRGNVLPVVCLRALYALDSPAPERASVVVLRAGTRRFGVIVDQLLGQHQTVIKPLGRMFRSLRGMAGSSILGSGEVALIFDVQALGQLAAQSADSHPRASRPMADPSTASRTAATAQGQAA